MSDDPYAQVVIHSPNKSAMAAFMTAPFIDMGIPIWIKPGIGDTLLVSYPLLRANDAQKIFQQIENYKKTHEKTTDRNGGVRDGLALGGETRQVDEGNGAEADPLAPPGQ
jgi:hypothetical protein